MNGPAASGRGIKKYNKNILIKPIVFLARSFVCGAFKISQSAIESNTSTDVDKLEGAGDRQF
jgi:hypothetical protein